MIRSHDWDRCFEVKDIDTMAANLNTNINILRLHIPNKMVQIRTKDAPMYAAELRNVKEPKIEFTKLLIELEKLQTE